MSVLTRAKEVTANLASASKRQAQRGKLEMEVRRLESKVSAEKNAIGHALFPLLETEILQVDVAEVQQHMTAIQELLTEILEKRAEIEAVRSAGDGMLDQGVGSIGSVAASARPGSSAERSARDAWASEGGREPEQGGHW
jgi:hypothetical protein